jgi:class I fructose-bisphosphate aldolase
MIGCARKLSRLFDARSGRTVLVPLDQGVGEGMLPGLDDFPGLLGMIRDFPVQGVVLNKGALRSCLSELPANIQAAAQLSGGTRHAVPPYIRSLVCSVHEALRLGADLVVAQVNIANDLEDRMLGDLGAVCDEAHNLGVPALAVIQPKGDRIVNEMDPSLICHCIRLGPSSARTWSAFPIPATPEAFPGPAPPASFRWWSPEGRAVRISPASWPWSDRPWRPARPNLRGAERPAARRSPGGAHAAHGPGARGAGRRGGPRGRRGD